MKHIEQGGNNVLKGQKQRLCIARALQDVQSTILDDSTSAVDGKDRFFDSLRPSKIPARYHQGYHHCSENVQYWRVWQDIVLITASINAIGTHEELLKDNPPYREVYSRKRCKSVDENQSQEGGGDSHEANRTSNEDQSFL